MSPWNEVMSKWKSGNLHSGSKKGPKVKGQKQAVAIMLSEKRAAKAGKSEYKAKGGADKRTFQHESSSYNFRNHLGRLKKK